MKYVPNLKTKYNEEIVPTLMKEFGYKSVMQAPRLEKIVINQGVGSAIQDKKILEFSLNEITAVSYTHLDVYKRQPERDRSVYQQTDPYRP